MLYGPKLVLTQREQEAAEYLAKTKDRGCGVWMTDAQEAQLSEVSLARTVEKKYFKPLQ